MGAVFALIFVSEAGAQIRRGHDRVVELSQGEAEEMWRTFRSAKIAGDYAMDFVLTHSPRRGESVKYEGKIYGTERSGRTLTRIRIKKAGVPDAKIHDFILFNSPKEPKVWRAEGGKFAEIPPNEWLKPLADGVILSPFDLLTPYVNWPHKYSGPGRIGQAVHFFDLAPSQKVFNGISGVRMALTREFNSPAQTKIFSEEGKALKTVSLGSVKKIDGLWIVAELSARDESTRDKDNLRFRAAKLNAVLPASIFDSSASPEDPPVVEMRAF